MCAGLFNHSLHLTCRLFAPCLQLVRKRIHHDVKLQFAKASSAYAVVSSTHAAAQRNYVGSREGISFVGSPASQLLATQGTLMRSV
jgi:hypothetical protein